MPDSQPAFPIVDTPLAGVKILEPKQYSDRRGTFFEAWHRPRFEQLGLNAEFVQDNVVSSGHRVLRGMHFQIPQVQLKLVSVLYGEVFDVVVDIRRSSATYGRWFGLNLSAANARQLWIEPGFAHGYQVLSEQAVLSYKCSAVYDPASDSTIYYADPAVGISWPLSDPILSPKDSVALSLAEFPTTKLFP